MKKSLNLSITASLIIIALSNSSAFAKSSSSAFHNDSVVSDTSKDKDTDAKVYINSQQRSLYQIALLSGISVSELRELNKGMFDGVDVVKVGESVVLPANSPLLSTQKEQTNKTASTHDYLPKLGSSDSDKVTSSDDELEKHVATVLSKLGSQDWDNMSSEKLKNQFENDAKNYAENYARSQINAMVVDPIRSAAQDFLGRFGTAELGFDVSDEGRLNNLKLKLFSPWYDSENTLIFSQVSYQEYEKGRNIGNFGIGQRWDVADKSWLIGYNVFLDHDFQRDHNRLGLGMEAWADYMKLAINYYTPLSDWKESRDFENYLERAARGFDVRFQGYLPSYPHLGASLMYEQYFGDEVALFGKDNLQKDPFAVTVGVDFTPVPLFTIKGQHKQGEQAHKEALVDVTMNYRIGVPLKDQLDPDMVAEARSLRGSRYDLVDRNNNIILEYKENKLSVDLVSIGDVTERTLVPVGVTVRRAKGGITKINWNGPDVLISGADGIGLCYDRNEIKRADGSIYYECPTGNYWFENPITTDTKKWSILVPPYVNDDGVRNPAKGKTTNPGKYTFSLTVWDSKNNAESNSVSVSVLPSADRITVLDNTTSGTPIPGSSAADAVPADGTTTITLTGRLHDLATNAYFADKSVFDSHPGTIIPADMSKINSIWTASNSDGAVKFVDGVTFSSCKQAQEEKCLLVKNISKSSSGSPAVDEYKIEVATDVALGKVDVALNLAPYSGNATALQHVESIFFPSGVAARIEIYETIGGVQNPAPVAFDASGTGVLTMVPVVGSTYTVVAYSDPGGTSPLPAPRVTWSLTGTNTAACLGDAITLPSAAPFFEVAKSVGTGSPKTSMAQYTPQGVGTALVSTTLTSINGVTLPQKACAGDQGFNLRVDVN